VGVVADQELAAGQEAPGLERGDLVEERPRIDHHAVAEHARLAGVAHPRRHQVRDQLLALDDQGVAGVGAAAVADHGVGDLGVEIDDLALAFIAPLGADHDHDRHELILSRGGRRPPRAGRRRM
jgi:hypothetical protein